MLSTRAGRIRKWRREGPRGFLITPKPWALRSATRKGKHAMKAFIMIAAVLTSALLTVPTVTAVADAKVADLRLNA